MKLLILSRHVYPRPSSILLVRKNLSTASPSSVPGPKPPSSSASRPSSVPPPPPSKILPATILVIGGTGAGLAGYYYYAPNAEIFRQAKLLLGIDQKSSPAAVPTSPINKKLKSNVTEEKKEVKLTQQQQQQQQKVNSAKPNILRQSQEEKQSVNQSVPVPAPPSLQKSTSSGNAASGGSSTAASALGGAAAAAATAKILPISGNDGKDQQKSEKNEDVGVKDPVSKHVLITALRAQQEALSESHEAKIRVIQKEYDRKLGNAAQVIEAERVVELRGKYEKASAALEAIEKGIEARSGQNERAKRLRALWAQVNALHARVNHPEYHSSTVTVIDKKSLLKSIEIPDKFVTQMVDSLPSNAVHSLESLKERFYNDVQPVARSVGLIKEGEGFSIWKYALGRLFSVGLVEVVRNEGKQQASTSASNNASPVQSTTHALDEAKRALDKSDLLSAAIAINQLKGLPKQVASDWLADARTLLETNQTLFVLMTYAASNNVF